MSHAQTERALLCDALLAVGPSAPTLCEGWTAHDLAAHVWLRENEFINSLGFFAPKFEARTEARVAELEEQLQYGELVDLVRHGPPRFSLFALPGADEAANGVELLIHGMDVRRPNGIAEPDRGPDFDAWVWKRLNGIASMMLRKPPVAVVLQWAGHPDKTVRVGQGDRIVTVVGAPIELLLYASGRREAADVELIGLEVGAGRTGRLKPPPPQPPVQREGRQQTGQVGQGVAHVAVAIRQPEVLHHLADHRVGRENRDRPPAPGQQHREGRRNGEPQKVEHLVGVRKPLDSLRLPRSVEAVQVGCHARHEGDPEPRS